MVKSINLTPRATGAVFASTVCSAGYFIGVFPLIERYGELAVIRDTLIITGMIVCVIAAVLGAGVGIVYEKNRGS